MKLSTQLLSVLLASVAPVSAIDIRLENSRDCTRSSGGFECLGYNPDTCCGLPSGVVYSIAFYGIELDWDLDCRGHEGGRCDVLKTSEVAYNTNFKCLSDGPYTGAGYGFRNTKARRTRAYSEECKPDYFVAANGERYSLSTLTTDQLAEFVGQIGNGTVPDSYEALKIVK